MFAVIDHTSSIGLLTHNFDEALAEMLFCLTHQHFQECYVVWID